ncbi:hypothetical protein ACJJTC_015639 [Scirpophaga incertulas]
MINHRIMIRDQFTQFKICYPFSINFAATSLNEKFHSSRSYLIFVTCKCFIYTICLLVPSIYNVITSTKNIASLFNVYITQFSYWFFFILSTLNGIRFSRKNKIQKLIKEFEDLDKVIVYNKKDIHKAASFLCVVMLLGYNVMLALLFYFDVRSKQITLLFITLIHIDRDIEITCMFHFVTLLQARLSFFNCHLSSLINRDANVGDRFAGDLLVCYKMIIHILKRVNAIWKYQNYRLVLRVFLVSSQFIVALCYGVLGQRVNPKLKKTLRLLVMIQDSDLNEEVRKSASKVIRLHSVIRPQLIMAPAVAVDLALFLRLLSTTATSVVLVLQLGIQIE